MEVISENYAAFCEQRITCLAKLGLLEEIYQSIDEGKGLGAILDECADKLLKEMQTVADLEKIYEMPTQSELLS